MEINRKGIERTHRAMGGEGSLVLALQTKQSPDSEVLDAALPPEDGGSPANGGWFQGPRSWLLFIEGLDEAIYPWIDVLASRLTSAGIEGTLTGAGSTGTPTWSRGMPNHPHDLAAAYRTPEDQRFWTTPGPQTQELFARSLGWLSDNGARIRVSINFAASFWMDAHATTQTMRQQLASEGNFFAEGYQQSRGEVRHAQLEEPGRLTLSTNGTRWEQAVADLRAAMMALPLEGLIVASISTHGAFEQETCPHYAHHDLDTRAYTTHPDTWAQFVDEPHPIQILTNRHLEKASDLSAWTTTRLDAQHVLVETRDLSGWFSGPRTNVRVREDSPVWGPAREAFGEMVLTWGRATELGIASQPEPEPDYPWLSRS